MKFQTIAVAFGTGLIVLGTGLPARADVQLSILNGRVTIVAKDATLRQILTEWARVGQTKVVNVERVPGGPMTLDMHDVPEQQALKQLLRSISGYVAAPRITAVATGSVFDRIIVMPTVAVAAPASGGGSAPSQPTYTPPPMVIPQISEDDTDDSPARGQGQPGNRGPVFVFPQPQQAAPQQPFNPVGGAPAVQPGPAANPTASYPGAPTSSVPVGVSAPGMVVPTPQVPPGQQPGQPFQSRLPREQQ